MQDILIALAFLLIFVGVVSIGVARYRVSQNARAWHDFKKSGWNTGARYTAVSEDRSTVATD